MDHKTLFTMRYSDTSLVDWHTTQIEPLTLDQLRARHEPTRIIQTFDRVADLIATGGYGQMTMADFDRWEAEHYAEISG